jgi:hypothetical protein
VLTFFFWDKDGILLVDYLEKSAAIREKYYFALLNKLKQQLVSKCQASFQDNAVLTRWPLHHRNWQNLNLKF